jgi:hypothetical protein
MKVRIKKQEEKYSYKQSVSRAKLDSPDEKLQFTRLPKTGRKKRPIDLYIIYIGYHILY